MGKTRGLFLLVGAAMSLTMMGCTQRLGDLSVVSTRNVTLDRVDLDQLPQVRGITGEDSRWVALCIPLGRPNLKDAVDDALNKGGGDVMVDVVMHRRNWWFLIGEDAIQVKGTVVKTRGQ